MGLIVLSAFVEGLAYCATPAVSNAEAIRRWGESRRSRRGLSSSAGVGIALCGIDLVSRTLAAL